MLAGSVMAVSSAAVAADVADMQAIAAKCIGCHGPDEQKSELRLDTLEAAMKGGKSGRPAFTPGDLNASEVIKRITLPLDEKGHMPPKSKDQLTAEEIVAVVQFIASGATEFPAAAPAPAPAPVPALAPGETDFSLEVLPIFQARCVECHGEEKQKADLRLDNYAAVMAGGESGASVVAGKPGDDIMPPKGDPLTDAQKGVIVKWINEGAKDGTPIVVVAKKPNILEILAKEVTPASEEAIAAVSATGALVLPLDQKSPLLRVDFSLQGESVTDAQLAALAGVADQVTWLNLANTKVTDAGLAQIAGLKNLTALHLEKTELGDGALAHLKGMPHLEYLNAYATKVTDAGLDHLADSKSLKKVYLWQSQVSQAGADKLAANVPDVVVNMGSELKIVDPEAEKKAAEAKAATEAQLAKLSPFFDEGGCCAKAAADGKLCDHPCCVEAAKEGKVCAKCNAKGAEKQAAAAAEKNTLVAFFDEGSCCAKANADGGKACEHPCCAEAAKEGKVCAKCNPKGAEKQAAASAEKNTLVAFFDEGSCCAKAIADGGKACEHPCCVEAAKGDTVCAKCNPKGAEKQANAKEA